MSSVFLVVVFATAFALMQAWIFARDAIRGDIPTPPLSEIQKLADTTQSPGDSEWTACEPFAPVNLFQGDKFIVTHTQKGLLLKPRFCDIERRLRALERKP